jgi:predicted O-methyltransferase YrrM
MSMKSVIKRLLKRSVSLIVRFGEEALQDRHNVDVILTASLNESGELLKTRDSAAYVQFLRSCLEHMTFSIREVKNTAAPRCAATKRFATLLYVLESRVPTIEFTVAKELGLIADGYAGLLKPLEYEVWAGDVGLHFSISSSFGRKGRLLSTIIRVCRSERCLELGTAYGMSTMFILEALKDNGAVGHIATLEGSEPQYSLASQVLKSRYGDMVSCHFGTTQETLAKTVRLMNGIDFLFHDAGHSREDYVRDFGAVCERLIPGSVVLIDDIRWEDPRFHTAPPRTYEGWIEVVAHPRVTRAVEIDGSLGLLLLQ